MRIELPVWGSELRARRARALWSRRWDSIQGDRLGERTQLMLSAVDQG